MNDPMLGAIREYFAGERAEMWLILMGCAGAFALSVAHMAMARDAFARGLGIVVILGVVLLTTTAVGLLRRDPAIEAGLVGALTSVHGPAAIAAERARIETVIGKYPLYRYVALGLSAIALLAVLWTRRPLVNGLAAGVLLLTFTLLVVDHHSEQRARGYAQKLAAPVP